MKLTDSTLNSERGFTMWSKVKSLHFDSTFLCRNRTLVSVVGVERMLFYATVFASASIAEHATVLKERCSVPGRRSTTCKVLPDDIQNTKPEVPMKQLGHEARHCLLKRESQATWPKKGVGHLDMVFRGKWIVVRSLPGTVFIGNIARFTIRRKGWHIYPLPEANILQWQWSDVLPLTSVPLLKVSFGQAVLRRLGWKVISHGEGASQGYKRHLSPRDSVVYIKQESFSECWASTRHPLKSLPR